MKKAQLNRLEQLKYRFVPSLTVVGLDDWEGLDELYQFYKENSPAATGCSWEEYFYKCRDAGFYSQGMTYRDHMESLGQW